MQKTKLWRGFNFILAAVLFAIVGGTGVAYAQSSSSSNYQMTESQFSSGSNLQSCSQQYCARATIGGGDSSAPVSSAAFTEAAQDSTPVLEVIIDPGASNLGTLSTESTATKTTTVRIRSFLSGGYLLQIVGTPPVYNGHNLATPSTPTQSKPGTEQFAINVAANTTPTVGAYPSQVPAKEGDTTVFGIANADYATANLYKFSSGDVVAHSLTESGRTDYTISMIVNISNVTPAGHYSGDFAAVVMPAY